LNAGFADILVQIVKYMHIESSLNAYIRRETTERIYQLLDFFEVLAELKEEE
jgi:hypothetical protein